ncbi:MAG: thioredoxin family protein [Bacteroidetes bacterium]|nr:thioredoxin family protein [Bacteroidota bacterium]
MKHIKILGPGCPKCKTLDKLTREVVEKEGIEATVTKVEDIMEIMKYNLLSTPALVLTQYAGDPGHHRRPKNRCLRSPGDYPLNTCRTDLRM